MNQTLEQIAFRAMLWKEFVARYRKCSLPHRKRSPIIAPSSVTAG
ncbi:MAG TPA: hypothetical protein VJ324_09380 [Candidatus Acidoferrum sp.]|nr:hypothetical protein [Candidatus Acidoferrum sp.]